MGTDHRNAAGAGVTSYAEVWIEMFSYPPNRFSHFVTSYAEVWIEILCKGYDNIRGKCHLLRGGVD